MGDMMQTKQKPLCFVVILIRETLVLGVKHRWFKLTILQYETWSRQSWSPRSDRAALRREYRALSLPSEYNPTCQCIVANTIDSAITGTIANSISGLLAVDRHCTVGSESRFKCFSVATLSLSRIREQPERLQFRRDWKTKVENERERWAVSSKDISLAPLIWTMLLKYS